MATIGQAFKPVPPVSILARNKGAGIKEWDMEKGNTEWDLEVSRIGKWNQEKAQTGVWLLP